MNLVLVLLQTNQPPAADAHHKKRQEASKHHSRDEGTFTASGQSHEDPAPGSCDQNDGESEMALP